MDRDVVIVGAGVVGAAIARELTRYRLDVTLLEAGPDVGAGTSKANTALLHTGFDAKPGTLESRLVARGYELLSEYAAESRDTGRADGRAAGRLGRRAARRARRHRRALARQRLHGDPRAGRRGALQPGAEPGPRRPRRARGPRREPDLPVHHAARVRDGGRARGLRAAPRHRGDGRRAAPGRRLPRRDGRRLAHGAPAGERRRAAQRRGRPHARLRALHGHPAARRADRASTSSRDRWCATSCSRSRRRCRRACWSLPPSSAT